MIGSIEYSQANSGASRNKGGTILIADDDASIRTVLSQALARAGFQVRSTSNASTLWKWVKDQEGDLVLTDVMMPDGSVFDFLPRIRMERPKLPIIVMSAQNTLLTAISAAEQGAYEYLPKPFDLDKMIELIKRAMAPVAEHRAIVQKRKAQMDEALPLIGRSQNMQDVYRTLSRVAPSDVNVLIEGEIGVGKKLTARTIHDYSPRKNGPYRIFNVAGYTDSSSLDALFLGQGLDGGGMINELIDGTLFLEGIDDAPFNTQSRLFAILSNMGDSAPRIIASTTKNLAQKVAVGEFREDLYYLLNVVSIKIPPLRERKSDIGDLARLFISRVVKNGVNDKILEKGAIEELEAWNWPGNVRELENFIKRLCLLNPDGVINAQTVVAALVNFKADEELSTTNSEEDLSASARNAFTTIFARAKAEGGLPRDLHSYAIRSVEKPLLELALKETKGNQIKAAEILGLNRNTLRKRLTEMGIH